MSHQPIATWFPTDAIIKHTHLYDWMQRDGFNDYSALHAWSCQYHALFLERVVERLPIIFDQPFSKAMDLSQGAERPLWFKDGLLNIANSCFTADSDALAIIEQNEMGRLRVITYAELNALSNQIAAAITHSYPPKSRFAIIMPMTIEAVAIHLGVLKAGCTTVAVAESFSKVEIEARLRIAETNAVFVQDIMLRNKKSVPLYNALVAEIALPMIVVTTDTELVLHRKQDVTFDSFLADGSSTYQAVSCSPQDYTTILFSSGTTGDPKAIPWTHATPIKCASDAYFHHDVHAGDRFLWPTSLGWMMGAWLIYATLINKATIALFEGTPNDPALGKFIQDQRITHVGVVPTFVKTWHKTRCMEQFDWSHVKLFSSTAECSNAEDMQYLMTLAGNKPVIEYCGGTEIAGAYITSTLLTPLAPATFTTPAMGMSFSIVDEEGHDAKSGEVMLLPPAIGLSTELLNSDHHQVYYENITGAMHASKLLRRHGDLIEQFDNGFYQLLGRADDTMKIGGIKVSCVEVERLLAGISGIKDVAVVGITPLGGGPSLLIVFVTIEKDCIEDKNILKEKMQYIIKTELNPLVRIHDIEIIEALPRTASNKILRRVLKREYEKKTYNQ